MSENIEKFQPNIESLQRYQCPEWFRNAKFGIYCHWGPQCVPRAGDWYARQMYIQDHRQNKVHLEKYGHPSEFGYKDIIPLWKAENFDPDALIKAFKDEHNKIAILENQIFNLQNLFSELTQKGLEMEEVKVKYNIDIEKMKKTHIELGKAFQNKILQMDEELDAYRDAIEELKNELSEKDQKINQLEMKI